MKVLADTNILIDHFVVRHPWYAHAHEIWELNKAGKLSLFVTASSLTDLFFLVDRLANTRASRAAVEVCLAHVEICNVTRAELELAAGKGEDFEDNLQIVCAEENKLDAIVTRDATGFAQSSIPVLNPAALLAKVK